MNVNSLDNRPFSPSNVEGKVKWFEFTKGFGFITSPNIPGDILLHANIVQGFGQSSVSSNALIECLVEENQGRYRVTEIIRYETADCDGSPQYTDMLDQIVLQPARTKWFCTKKAYGFAVAFETPGDIFIGHTVLSAAGLTHLVQGEAIAIALKQTQKGLVATKVSPWQ